MRWLNYGDQNSNKQRWKEERRNKIYKIRDSEGRWLEEEREVIREIHTFYEQLFTSEREDGWNRRDFEEILEDLPRQITKSINECLTQEDSAGEVQLTVNQLGVKGTGTG